MAPTPLRKPISRDRFPQSFSTLKTSTFYDPGTRSAGNHTIRTISWSPAGTLIATGSSDKTLRIWNPEKPQVKNSTELKGHTGAIEKVIWNPTREAELASVSLDGTVRFWDVRRKVCEKVVELGARGLSACWSDDGEVLLVGCGERSEDEALVPIHVTAGFQALPAIPQGGQVNQVLFAPTRRESEVYHLLITTGNGQIKIASYPRPYSPNQEMPTSLDILYSFQAHTSAAQCLSLSPNGRWLATGGSDAMTMLWDTIDWVCHHPLSHATGTVRGVSFSFDGAYLTTAAEDTDELEIIHVESGDTIARVPLNGNQAGMPMVAAAKGTPAVVLEEGIGSKGIGKGLVKVSNVGSVSMANCVAWHPQRYWLAYAGEPGGLRIIMSGPGAGTAL